MTMKQPHAGVLSSEAKDSISPSRNLDCITEDSAGEIVWGGTSIVSISFIRSAWLEVWWIRVFIGVVGAPAD